MGDIELPFAKDSLEAIIAKAVLWSYIRSLYHITENQEIRMFIDENGRLFNEIADCDEPMIDTYEGHPILYLRTFPAPTKEEIDTWIAEHHFEREENETEEDYKERLNHSIFENFAYNFLDGFVNEILSNHAKIAQYYQHI